jgi:hypothetical protein
LGEIARISRTAGATPVWLYLYLPQEGGLSEAEVQELSRVARDAGFVTLDFSDVYVGHDLPALQVSESDFHPNAEGHRVIAGRLYEELLGNAELGVPVAAQTTTHEERP